jgi:hypothetical protein
MLKHRLGLWLTALAFGLMLAGTPLLAAPAATPDAVPAASGTAETPRAHETKRPNSYAQRESATPRAAGFKGSGVGIYIGGSTLAVVLVIVLIVVLL